MQLDWLTTMSDTQTILKLERASEAQLRLLAELIALKLCHGDVIALHGDLGAGKTTFARALIQAIADDPDFEVPSPTFAIAQTYDELRLPLTHFDWYRLTDPGELEEIGFPWSDPASASEGSLGAALVEWPDRARSNLPDGHLRLRIVDSDDGPEYRTISLEAAQGDHPVAERIQRLADIWGFATRISAQRSTALARIRHVNGDASSRSYSRVQFDDGQYALLMDSPAMPDGPPLKCGQPYSRVAHLAETIGPFLAIGQALANAGLTVPAAQCADPDLGFALIDDLGDAVFDRIAATDIALREKRTSVALDTLLHLRAHGRAPDTVAWTGDFGHVTHALPVFDRGALQAEVGLLLDWAWPRTTSGPPTPDVCTTFEQAWDEVLQPIVDDTSGWVLRDFHSPNLIWCENRQGIGRVGIIDFQDAMRGSWAYDVASLIQDARVDIPRPMRERLLARYCDGAAGKFGDFDATAFKRDFAILGAQRATKIIGIFYRLAARDGKAQYLQHLPRVVGYLKENLSHAALAPIRDWFAAHMPAVTTGPRQQSSPNTSENRGPRDGSD